MLELQALEGKDVKDLLMNVGSGGGSAAAAAAPAPPAAGAAAAAALPPPDPTFINRSFTSLPSRACSSNMSEFVVQYPLSFRRRCTLAKREHQMGSTSGTLAAVMRVWSLSDCTEKRNQLLSGQFRRVAQLDRTYGDLNTVIGQDEGGVGSCELGGRHCEGIDISRF